MLWNFIAGATDAVLRETLLFAALGILLGGLDDLIVDLCYMALRARRAIRRESNSVSDFPSAEQPLRLVVFVAAWDESAVIGTMLRTALGRFDHPDYTLYVGAYPNDPATMRLSPRSPKPIIASAW
jgi:adsorption protein B